MRRDQMGKPGYSNGNWKTESFLMKKQKKRENFFLKKQLFAICFWCRCVFKNNLRNYFKTRMG